MEATQTKSSRVAFDFERIPAEVTEWDQRTYAEMVSVELSPAQRERVATPSFVDPRQHEVLAVHWHPEFVPHELIAQRIAAMFPNARQKLIIPTQHNELLTWDGYAGVEIDCFSAGFNRKVQLLAHFSAARVERADVLRSMLAHTFKYRASQLYEYIDTLLEPAFDDRVQRAAASTGASEDLVRFVRLHVRKLRELIDQHRDATREDMLKNKLVRNYFNMLRAHYPDQLILHAQAFLTAVKKIVKAGFSLAYFYRTREIVEEVRGLSGGIVIPHPEQFWPILLADYDIDGIEVWNPQSREYTEFLIHVVNRGNKTRPEDQRSRLIFMGDDTHFGEKVLPPAYQDPEKGGRELGVQPAWEDPAIRKGLCIAGIERGRVIEEYQERLQ